MRIMRSLWLGVSLCLTAMLWLGDAGAQTADEFYLGKRELTLITSGATGGGYDQYTRMLARHMSKHLPGTPTIVVQNMVGGGGIRAANFLFNVAPRDGSVFGLIDRGMPTAPLLYGDKSQARFDAVRLSWIGSVMRETGMGVVAARSVVKTIEDAKRHEIFFGSTGPETDPAMFVRLVNDLLGTRLKAIHGYKGQPEEFQAIEKGELDGLFMSGWSGPGRAYVRERMGRGELRLLVQMSPRKDALHPDTPTILELVSAPDARQIVQLVLDRMTLGRPVVGGRRPRAQGRCGKAAPGARSNPRRRGRARDQGSLRHACGRGRAHAPHRGGRGRVGWTANRYPLLPNHRRRRPAACWAWRS